MSREISPKLHIPSGIKISTSGQDKAKMGGEQMVSQSMAFGGFIKSLVNLEESAKPGLASPQYGRDILFLFNVNPQSTLDIVQARIKHFPQEFHKHQVLLAINQLVLAYQQVQWSKLPQLNLVEAEYWRGYCNFPCNLGKSVV